MRVCGSVYVWGGPVSEGMWFSVCMGGGGVQ